MKKKQSDEYVNQYVKSSMVSIFVGPFNICLSSIQRIQYIFNNQLLTYNDNK